MNFISDAKTFFKYAGYDKMFLTLVPAAFAYFIAFDVFKCYNTNGITILIFVLPFLHMSVQLFDDFYDWVSGKTNKRNELEQLGIRGNYNKCSYIYKEKESPRTYFYFSCLLFILGIILLCRLSNTHRKIILPILITILAVSMIIVYSKWCKKLISHIGYEFFVAFLCAPTTMFLVFYAMTNTITSKLVFSSIIFFFHIYNICYTASLLNYKPDKMTEKYTLPTIFDNINFKLYFSFFLSVIPYIILILAIQLNYFPKLSYITLIMLPFSIWHFYLMYLYEKHPEKPIHWNILMGGNKEKDLDEQNNMSWYTVRYKFARNIFVIFATLLIFSFIKYSSFFIF